MSNIDTINVGGLDYSIEDSTARADAASAVTVSAYVENGNTASRAYPVLGTPVNWKGSLYYTTATIAQGATLSSSNLTAAANIGQMLTNIKTYVGSDSKLHFTDATGADSVLPFSSGIVSFTYTAYETATARKPEIGVVTCYGSGAQSNTINFGRTIKTVSVRCTGGAGTVGGQSISSGVTRTFSNISSLSLQVSVTARAIEDVQTSGSASTSMTVVITLTL